MNRLLKLFTVVALLSASAFAADRDLKFAPEMPFATTGFITKVDIANRSFKVRNPSTDQARVSHEGHFFLPHGVRLRLPIRTPEAPPTEYTVNFGENTVFRGDDGEAIRVEDFRLGDSVSIHGTLNGLVITATRVSKWPH